MAIDRFLGSMEAYLREKQEEKNQQAADALFKVAEQLRSDIEAANLSFLQADSLMRGGRSIGSVIKRIQDLTWRIAEALDSAGIDEPPVEILNKEYSPTGIINLRQPSSAESVVKVDPEELAAIKCRIRGALGSPDLYGLSPENFERNIVELNLSGKTYSSLKRRKVNTVGKMISFSAKDLLLFRNFGPKTLDEVITALATKDYIPSVVFPSSLYSG